MTFSRHARPAFLGVGAALLALTGCGNDAERGGTRVPLVEVVTNRLDGAPPDHDLAIRPMEQGVLGAPIPLTPVAGQPRVYEARGAKDGPHLLALPDGWGPLWASAPPRVAADGYPAKMNAGRTHTLYLTSRAPGRLLGEEWSARRVLPDDRLGPPLPMKVELDGNGWVLLRFRPEDWAGPVAVQGRFEDRALTEQFLTTLKEGGRPVLRQLDPEPAGSLRVVVVGVPTGEERWVHLRVLDAALEDRQQAPARDGVAEFREVATSRGGLELTVGDGPGAPTYRVAAEVWARDGEVRVRDVPRLGVAVRLKVPRPADVRRVQARKDEEDSYGWIPFHADEDSVVLTATEGTWHVLLQTAAGFATGAFRVRDALVGDAEVGPFEPAARVAGSVLGPAGALRLQWRRIEGGRPVLAHGFVVGVGRGGGFEAVLPAGDYTHAFHGPEGPRGTPRTRRLEAGDQVHLDLEAPLPGP